VPPEATLEKRNRTENNLERKRKGKGKGKHRKSEEWEEINKESAMICYNWAAKHASA